MLMKLQPSKYQERRERECVCVFAFKIWFNEITGGVAGSHSPAQGRSLIQCRCVFCMIKKEILFI